jgi:hypothetical protein
MVIKAKKYTLMIVYLKYTEYNEIKWYFIG